MRCSRQHSLLGFALERHAFDPRPAPGCPDRLCMPADSFLLTSKSGLTRLPGNRLPSWPFRPRVVKNRQRSMSVSFTPGQQLSPDGYAGNDPRAFVSLASGYRTSSWIRWLSRLEEHLETFLAKVEAGAGVRCLSRIRLTDPRPSRARVASTAPMRSSWPPPVNDVGFVPPCGARRTLETAAHLLDHLIPRVPVRPGDVVLSDAVTLPLRCPSQLLAPASHRNDFFS